jgi:hypothetical protein
MNNKRMNIDEFLTDTSFKAVGMAESYENDPNKLLTIGEISRKLNVSEHYFYAPCRRKGPNAIPCIRIGKYLRYHLPSVLAHFVKQNQKHA